MLHRRAIYNFIFANVLECKSSNLQVCQTCQEQPDITRSYPNKSIKQMNKWADKKWRHTKYENGDQVMIKMYNMLRHRGVHKAHTRRSEGPFKVLKCVGKVAYIFELPTTLRFHPVFHVSMIKPFHEDKRRFHLSKIILSTYWGQDGLLWPRCGRNRLKWRRAEVILQTKDRIPYQVKKTTRVERVLGTDGGSMAFH